MEKIHYFRPLYLALALTISLFSTASTPNQMCIRDRDFIVRISSFCTEVAAVETGVEAVLPVFVGNLLEQGLPCLLYTSDTDATRMLEATFHLLKEGKEYMNADVLWVSDFKIPHASPAFMEMGIRDSYKTLQTEVSNRVRKGRFSSVVTPVSYTHLYHITTLTTNNSNTNHRFESHSFFICVRSFLVIFFND